MPKPSDLRPITQEVVLSFISSKPYRKWLKRRRKRAKCDPRTVTRLFEDVKLNIYLSLLIVIWRTIDNPELVGNIENRAVCLKIC
jgi:hypothetical protein